MTRFWHPLWLVLPIAVAAALRHLPRAWVVVGLVVAAVAGGSRKMPDLVDRYWCADDALERALQSADIQDGVVFVRGLGKRAVSWPRLGVDPFVCDAMLEFGDGMRLNNPARPAQGLRVRHALATAEETKAFMDAHHPGESAWLVIHDVPSDTYRIAPVKLW